MMHKIKTQTIIAVLTIYVWIGIGTISYHVLEAWSLVDSFYFSVTTLTTVGYGDLTPTHDVSKIFTSLYILTGVSVVLASLGIIGSNYISKRTDRLIKKKRKTK